MTRRSGPRARFTKGLPEEVPRADLDDDDDGPGEDRVNHGGRWRTSRCSSQVQALRLLLAAGRSEACRDELARAELAGEISEFHALSLHTSLAIAERSELASDYLEMAEAVAASPYEHALLAEHRAAYDLLHDDPLRAAQRCLATLDHGCQTEGLWIKLLVALHRLGQVETIDAALRGFDRLSRECTSRLVSLLSSEPELGDIRTRPACRQLLDRRAAE
jgi:hypothetical protein